jgi:AhpD family alkylhydroperoxidase
MMYSQLSCYDILERSPTSLHRNNESYFTAAEPAKKEKVMQPRLDAGRLSAEGYRAVYALEQYVHHSGLELKLLELVRLRASLLNGCAYCVDMHTKDARAEGETEQRLYGIPVWRETPFFTDRERAALAWTEAVTLVGKDHVPDDVFELARSQFSEKELVDLTLAILSINNWNRLAISFRAVPGSYQRPAEMKTGTR